MSEYTHSVSVILVENMNRFERGNITKSQLLAVVDSLDAISVSEQQAKFFAAFRQLIDKVEAVINGVSEGD